uniref:Uncharacterized protein n=1 Tax=Tetranychus urticae TaxID=32264 RepID=T1KTD0_TETUR
MVHLIELPLKMISFKLKVILPLILNVDYKNKIP